MDSRQLLTLALARSEELLLKIGTDVYENKTFLGFDVPYLDTEPLEGRVIGVLKSELKLAADMRFWVEPRPYASDLLGIVFYLRTGQIDVHPASHLDPHKARLVICKELCQIYLDRSDGGPESGTLFRDIRKQLFDLIEHHNETATNFDDLKLPVNDKNKNEFVSFFMAINLFFPRKHWQDFKKIYALVNGASDAGTIDGAAGVYAMPEFVLKFFSKRMLEHYETKNGDPFVF